MNYLPCIFNYLREVFYRVKKIFFFTGKIFLNKSLVLLFSADMVFVAVKDYAFAGCRHEK